MVDETETQTLSPEEVREKRAALHSEQTDARIQKLHADVVLRRASKQIEELQSACPHENQYEDFIGDAADLKLKKICEDCGKIL